MLQGVAWHPSGRVRDRDPAIAPRTSCPMTRLLQGWTITNGLADPVAGRAGRPAAARRAEPCASPTRPTWPSRPTASGPSSRAPAPTAWRWWTSTPARSPAARPRPRSDETSSRTTWASPTEFVDGYVPTGNSPRGVGGRPGRAHRLGRQRPGRLAHRDRHRRASRRWARRPGGAAVDHPGPLGRAALQQRRASPSDRQLSCHTCHPDGHVDGLTYDIEADGIGVARWTTGRSAASSTRTRSSGRATNATLARQCGPRLAVFFTRIQPFTPEELAALDDYIITDPAAAEPPSAPRRRADRRPSGGARCSSSARTTNDGREIHARGPLRHLPLPALFTDRAKHDVGTKWRWTSGGKFDVPAPEQHLRLRALPPQRHGRHARGDLDAVQSRTTGTASPTT